MKTKRIHAASLRDSDVPIGGVFHDAQTAHHFVAALRENVKLKFVLLTIDGSGGWYGRGLKRDKEFAAAFYDGFRAALIEPQAVRRHRG